MCSGPDVSLAFPSKDVFGVTLSASLTKGDETLKEARWMWSQQRRKFFLGREALEGSVHLGRLHQVDEVCIVYMDPAIVFHLRYRHDIASLCIWYRYDLIAFASAYLHVYIHFVMHIYSILSFA